MALKEIKERINSVKSTRKTTSAMKMVASAKLHKAQGAIGNMLPYSDALNNLMKSLLSNDLEIPLCENRKAERVAIVAFSSDSSLCGAFNANVIRETMKALDDYKSLPNEDVHLYIIGKKVSDAAKKSDLRIEQNFEHLAEKPDYNIIAELAETLMQQFEKNEIDRVELIYHHFKSAGSQILMRETMLPLVLPEASGNAAQAAATYYIFEPSYEALLNDLTPKCVKLKLYTALLDSNASEHAARMMAMQVATDNADDIISELTVEYNKSRQQAITSELLDIISGSMGR